MQINQSPLIRSDTMDFIWDNSKGATESQLRSVEEIDGKTFQILSVASVVIGLVAFALPEILNNSNAKFSLLAASIAYLFCGVLSLFAIMVRRFRSTLQADNLWPMFWDMEPQKIKHAMVKDIAEAYAHNKGLIKDKTNRLKFAIAFLIAETYFIAVTFIFVIWV